jgi:hypothetical protein
VSDYYRIFRTEPGWQALFPQYDPEIVLVSPESNLARALRDEAGWIEELRTSRESLFVRRDIARSTSDGN